MWLLLAAWSSYSVAFHIGWFAAVSFGNSWKHFSAYFQPKALPTEGVTRYLISATLFVGKFPGALFERRPVELPAPTP
jgi:hypothetical protein